MKILLEYIYFQTFYDSFEILKTHLQNNIKKEVTNISVFIAADNDITRNFFEKERNIDASFI